MGSGSISLLPAIGGSLERSFLPLVPFRKPSYYRKKEGRSLQKQEGRKEGRKEGNGEQLFPDIACSHTMLYNGKKAYFISTSHLL